MLKYNKTVQLPVICASNGTKFGSVKDIIFCARQKSIVAFLIECRQKYLGLKVIPFTDILTLENEAIIINNPSCAISKKKAEKLNIIQQKFSLHNAKVYSQLGHDLGIVKDILFDSKTGRLDALEVSEGFLQDITSGRNIVPIIGSIKFGEDTIVVDKDSVEEIVATGGGIKNILYPSQITEEVN